MQYRIARLILAAMFMGVGLYGQESVCELFKDLKAADGRELVVSGELIVSKDLMVLGAGDCAYEYRARMEGPGIRLFRVWPTALRLRPSPLAPAAQIQQLQDAAAEADRLRSAGKVVEASATFSGRLRLGDAGEFPAELTFDSLADLKIGALPDAGGLPVIPICELFQNLPAWKGKRIAVRGKVSGTFEGSWLSGRCQGEFYTNGYRWPVSLSYAGPKYYTDSTARIAQAKEPSLPPKGAETFRGRNNVVRTAAYIGRLRMRDEYRATCREGGDYITNGFGHLGAAAAELVVEEVRNVELTKAEADESSREEPGCRPPNVEALCAAANTLSRAASLGCAARVVELAARDGIDSKKGSESEALSQAIRAGNPAIVKILIDAGAPVNPVHFRLFAPLGEAAHWRRLELMKTLLKAGAKVDATDHKGTTYLAGYGVFNTGGLRLLLEAGANPNASDRDGRTALMDASGYGYEDAVVLLIEHGAVVDQKDNKGRTALMYAAAGQYVDAIPHLLGKGANVYARDLDGKQALDLARTSKNQVALELLSAAMKGGR